MSLHHQDWEKILGGLVLAATGVGLAGAGPLSGLGTALGTAGTAGGTASSMGPEMDAMFAAEGYGFPSAAPAASGGFASLLTPSLISSGIGTSLSGTQGTPQSTMKQPEGVPAMASPPDPLEFLKSMQQMGKGGSGFGQGGF